MGEEEYNQDWSVSTPTTPEREAELEENRRKENENRLRGNVEGELYENLGGDSVSRDEQREFIIKHAAYIELVEFFGAPLPPEELDDLIQKAYDRRGDKWDRESREENN